MELFESSVKKLTGSTKKVKYTIAVGIFLTLCLLHISKISKSRAPRIPPAGGPFEQAPDSHSALSDCLAVCKDTHSDQRSR